ncbi:hypothetical protein WJX74_004995 [Apatococcus lobatus]|uniref:Galactose oxidase n=1 Tax=Apatococcus lobatus TaxID=904363 RepID=A0AAW1RQ88_9CHLO
MRSYICGCVWACWVHLICARVLALQTSSIQDAWQLLHSATSLPTGSNKQPAIRYSHLAAVYKDEMIISHGYFYDAENHKPRWLSDSWAMGLDAPHKWRQLSPHLDRQDALQAYGSKLTPSAPCGRYGSTGVIKDDNLFLFGGTDGGFHLHGRDGFEQGHDYDELWVLDLKTSKWQLLGRGATSKQPWPAPRHLHGAVVVRNQMLIHGGVGSGFGDVWAWDIGRKSWKQLFNPESQHGRSPGSMFAAGYIPIDCPNKQGFLLYGGRPDAGGHEELSADVWYFDLIKTRWTKLRPTQDSGPQPSGRFYMGLAALNAGVQACSADLVASKDPFERIDGPLAFTAGASVHTPTMECTDETWSLSWDLEHRIVRWAAQKPLPFGYYHNTLVARNDTVYSFGGHLCGDTQGQLPHRYLNTVQSFTVKPPATKTNLKSLAGAGKASSSDKPHPGLHLAGAGSFDRELKSLS